MHCKWYKKTLGGDRNVQAWWWFQTFNTYVKTVETVHFKYAQFIILQLYLNIKLKGEGINMRKRNKKEMRDFYSGCEEVTGLSMPFINEELGNWTTSMWTAWLQTLDNQGRRTVLSANQTRWGPLSSLAEHHIRAKMEKFPRVHAGSQHTRSHPWQGPEGENLTGKADEVFRGFEKASSWDPTHDKVTRRKPDRQGRSGFQGFRKAAPGAHLKDDICLSDACLNRSLPNFCDTGRRPSPISSQIRINLEL